MAGLKERGSPYGVGVTCESQRVSKGDMLNIEHVGRLCANTLDIITLLDDEIRRQRIGNTSLSISTDSVRIRVTLITLLDDEYPSAYL